MIIANPQFDSIFKYLMDDTECARYIISSIIGKEIIEISLKSEKN